MSHPFTSPFLALQVPSISSGPQLSNIVSLPNAVRLSGLPCLPHSGISESPPVFLDVSSSTGGGVLPQITISGQGLQYLFQGLSARGITLQSLEGLSRLPVGRTVSPTLEQASVLLPCNRLDACRPTLLVPELGCVTSDSVVESGTEYECATMDSPHCAVPDSLLLDDARVPASQAGVDSDLEMYDSTAAHDCQPSQAKSDEKAVSSGSNTTETSPAVSGNIVSKNPLETLAPETENSCILSHDSPASDSTVDTTLPPDPPTHKNMCREVSKPSADDSDCGTIPQSALVQCPPPTSDVPKVASSDLPPETSLGEQMIVSIAKGLVGVASISSKQPAVGPAKQLSTVQDEEAMTEHTNDPSSSSSTSFALVLAERETKLVQMDESDEELELPAGAPSVVVIPTPPPLPFDIPAAKRCLPSAGECTKLLHLGSLARGRAELVVELVGQLYTVSHRVSASSFFTDWCGCTHCPLCCGWLWCGHTELAICSCPLLAQLHVQMLRMCVHCLSKVQMTSNLKTCFPCLHLMVCKYFPMQVYCRLSVSEICCALQVNGCSIFVDHFTDKQLFGEHISLAVSPADDAGLDLKPCPPHQSGPEGAHGDTATLSAVASVCKRTSHEVSQYTGPSPKKLKSRSTTEGGEAEKESVVLEREVVEVGEEAKIDPVGVPTWSGFSEPPVAVHEGDSPFPAALPNKAAQLSTSDNECGVPDDETSDETDSDADDSFTCVPPAQDSEATFHVVPEQTLANSQEVETSPLYSACPAPTDIAGLDHPAASTLAPKTVQMFSFEDKGNTLYAQVFSASNRLGKCEYVRKYVCMYACAMYCMNIDI